MREYVPWDDDQSVRKKGGRGGERENGNYDTSFSTHTDASAALVIFHLAPSPSPFSLPPPLASSPPCCSHLASISPSSHEKDKRRTERANERSAFVLIQFVERRRRRERKNGQKEGRYKIPPKLRTHRGWHTGCISIPLEPRDRVRSWTVKRLGARTRCRSPRQRSAT